jgi:predicted Rossmann-fold nucleotide-binding protein
LTAVQKQHGIIRVKLPEGYRENERERMSTRKYKIGVYGSNITESEEAVQFAQTLGKELAQNNVVVITGACSGMPYAVASAAKQKGADVWGFSPEVGEEEQKRAYPLDDITIYTKLFYVPQQHDRLFFLAEIQKCDFNDSC